MVNHIGMDESFLRNNVTNNKTVRKKLMTNEEYPSVIT